MNAIVRPTNPTDAAGANRRATIVGITLTDVRHLGGGIMTGRDHNGHLRGFREDGTGGLVVGMVHPWHTPSGQHVFKARVRRGSTPGYQTLGLYSREGIAEAALTAALLAQMQEAAREKATREEAIQANTLVRKSPVLRWLAKAVASATRKVDRPPVTGAAK